MPATLAELISDDRVEFEELHQRYGPVLNLVNVLIGVVPNCDPYLEIWPAGFRTYNLMVPNFLNLPPMLFGRGAPKDIVGLAMYTSSRAASCAYCSAHTCSFALRRGSSADAVTGAKRTDVEQAAVDISEALSFIPHYYTPEYKKRLVAELGPSDAEWVVMGVAMMGFLNKFMDAMGIELEAESVGDVADLIEPTGWSVGQHGWAGVERADGSTPPPTDTLGTFIRVGRNARGAIKLEKTWMEGIPKQQAAIRSHVADIYGYDEPLITAMAHAKPARALGAMLRHNLDPSQSELGVDKKALAGLVFAVAAGNERLVAAQRTLAEQHGATTAEVEAAASPDLDLAAAGLDDATAAVLTAARAIAPSPAAVDAPVIGLVADQLSSAQTVELAVWVSVCQLIHRLSVYFEMTD
ncbi:MAG: hypothetical protein AAF962_04980 [Actinomycetota bacterium]